MEENERLRQEPEFQAPAELSPKIKKALAASRRKGRLFRILSTTFNVLQKAAVFFLLLSIGLGSAYVVSPAARKKIDQIAIHIQNEVAVFQNSRNTEPVFSDWADLYAPAYVPEGYTLWMQEGERNYWNVEYRDQSGHRLIFSQYMDEPHATVDNENLLAQKTIQVGDVQGYLFIAENEVKDLYWGGSPFFWLQATDRNLTEEELIKTAESTRIIAKEYRR